jgi:hypothetical protein
MKNTLRLAIIGGLVAVGIAQSQAQTTNTNVITFTTNMEQVLNITLTGVSGTNGVGGNPVRIGNKDIINSLNLATGAGFSSKARLVLINGVSTDTNAPTAIVVRDSAGGTNADTDVSGFFSIGTIGTPIVKSKTSSQGKTTGTEWSINSFIFGSTGADTNGPSATSIFFELQGFTKTTLSSGAFTSAVNGPATVNFLDAVLQGKISASAGKLKTLQVSSP